MPTTPESSADVAVGVPSVFHEEDRLTVADLAASRKGIASIVVVDRRHMETVNARIRDLTDLPHDGGGERDLQIALPDSNQGTALEEHLLPARFLAITPFIRAAAPHALPSNSSISS